MKFYSSWGAGGVCGVLLGGGGRVIVHLSGVGTVVAVPTGGTHATTHGQTERVLSEHSIRY